MKVARLRPWPVDRTNYETHFMAGGRTCATEETLILALSTDTGLNCRGEVGLMPDNLPAFASGALSALAETAPKIMGITPEDPGQDVTPGPAILNDPILEIS